MDFEFYKISEKNWQMYQLKEHSRVWLASFNSISTLIDYYIKCHNLTYDTITLKGVMLNKYERNYYDDAKEVWKISEV